MLTGINTALISYSALIQAIATVVLVVLTAYYVQETRKSAEELARSRKGDFLPMIAIRLEARAPRTVDIFLSNIGQGIAQHPTIMLPFENPQKAADMMTPGEENVLATFTNIGILEILETPEEKRVLRVAYKDIFGRTIVSQARIVADEAPDESLLKETIALEDWKIILPKEA